MRTVNVIKTTLDGKNEPIVLQRGRLFARLKVCKLTMSILNPSQTKSSPWLFDFCCDALDSLLQMAQSRLLLSILFIAPHLPDS